MSVDLSLGSEIERTQRPHLDYNELSARLQLNSELSRGLIVSAFAGYANRAHLGNYPTRPDPRADQRLLAGATLAHREVNFAGFMPTLTYQYTRQFSNVSFFDYDSHDVSMGLSRNF